MKSTQSSLPTPQRRFSTTSGYTFTRPRHRTSPPPLRYGHVLRLKDDILFWKLELQEILVLQ
jgi:hypothetical protein